MKMLRRIVPAVLLAGLAFAMSGAANAAGTIRASTKIQCVLAAGVDSSTLKVGTDFKLRVDDPSQPALAGATIHGHVTDVNGPAGLTRAAIGFVIDYIHFKNGTRSNIHAHILSKNVTNTNTAYAQQERVKLSLPPMTPYGTVTPGPIAWQMSIPLGNSGGQGSSVSVGPRPIGNTGGYIYAAKPYENIVIPPGSPVTIQLTNDLATP
jgi:hypothetical protein